jgi:hypothetical protein
MHSTEKLAAALRDAGLNAMALKAKNGWYHDFLSPLDMPSVQLAHDLKTYAEAQSWPRRNEAQAVLERHMNGDFDATKEESEAWARTTEGQQAMRALIGPHAAGASESTAQSRPAMEIGRLALRQDGPLWVAYFAAPDTMDGAVKIASILLTCVADPKHKATFMALMRDIVSDIIESNIGHRPDWPQPDGQPPKESESRS